MKNVLIWIAAFLSLSASAQAIELEVKVKYPSGEIKLFSPTEKFVALPLGSKNWVCSFRAAFSNDGVPLLSGMIGCREKSSGSISMIPIGCFPTSSEYQKIISALQDRSLTVVDSGKQSKTWDIQSQCIQD